MYNNFQLEYSLLNYLNSVTFFLHLNKFLHTATDSTDMAQHARYQFTVSDGNETAFDVGGLYSMFFFCYG